MYDPDDAEWGKEGDEVWTGDGNLNSLAEDTVELVWSGGVPDGDWNAILDKYYALLGAGFKVDSITVPSKKTASLQNWETYFAFDETGIGVERPVWSYAGRNIRQIRWKFKRVCHSVAPNAPA